MTDNLLDDTLLLEIGKGLAGERTVDLQTIDEGSDGDEAVRLNVLVELVRDGLVEDDGVLGLVLDCRIVSGGSQYSRAIARQFVCEAMRKEVVSGRACGLCPIVNCQRTKRGLKFACWSCCAYRGVVFTYPFPWTTSSSASCHLLLRVPGQGQYHCSSIMLDWFPGLTILSDVVDVMGQSLLRSV